MKIVTEYVEPARKYMAYDENTYDGAPDAGLRARAVGWGDTAEEAIEDLQAWLEELE